PPRSSTSPVPSLPGSSPASLPSLPTSPEPPRHLPLSPASRLLSRPAPPPAASRLPPGVARAFGRPAEWLGTLLVALGGCRAHESRLRLTRRGSRVANIKSQIKRIKQNEKRRMRNKSVKSSLKTAIRKFREAADGGDKETATAAMRAASRALDKAVSKGVIHKNQAANKKSAMAIRTDNL